MWWWSVLDVVGGYGFVGMWLCVVSWLWNHDNRVSLYVFCVGTVLCVLLNVLLKVLFCIPRANLTAMQREAVRRGAWFVYLPPHGIPYDLYGFPSGHAQLAWSILTYAWFLSLPALVLGMLSVVTGLTCIQRYLGLHHTLSELVGGTVVGMCVGYAMYVCKLRYTRGKVTPKQNDWSWLPSGACVPHGDTP
jgi:membrane-associated phospholipid phosphatase